MAVVQVMHPHAHPAMRVQGPVEQGAHQVELLRLAAHRRAVLQVERHVEDGVAGVFGHLRLQLQALDHAFFDPRVVVAHGQGGRTGLGAEEGLAWVDGGEGGHEGAWPWAVWRDVSQAFEGFRTTRA
jgi:hypothetical protein